jgi:hypothetical protein
VGERGYDNTPKEIWRRSGGVQKVRRKGSRASGDLSLPDANALSADAERHIRKWPDAFGPRREDRTGQPANGHGEGRDHFDHRDIRAAPICASLFAAGKGCRTISIGVVPLTDFDPASKPRPVSPDGALR